MSAERKQDNDMQQQSVAEEMGVRFPHPSSMSLGMLLQIIRDKSAQPVRILDYGAGSGRFMQATEQKTPIDYVAYDIETRAEPALRRSAAEFPNQNISVIIGDENDTSLTKLQEESRQNGQFDIVIAMFGVFCSMPRDIAKSLVASISKTMKPDGVFLAAVMNGKGLQNKIAARTEVVQEDAIFDIHFVKNSPPSRVHAFTPEDLVELFQSNGFSGVITPKHELPESKANGIKGEVDAIAMRLKGKFDDSSEIVGVFTKSNRATPATSSDRIAATSWADVVGKSFQHRILPVVSLHIPRILDMVESENELTNAGSDRIFGFRRELEDVEKNLGNGNANVLLNDSLEKLAKILTDTNSSKYEEQIAALEAAKLRVPTQKIRGK